MPTASNSGWRIHRRYDKNIEVEEVLYQVFYLKPCIFIEVDDLLTTERYRALSASAYEAVSFDQSDNEFQEQMNKSTG